MIWTEVHFVSLFSVYLIWSKAISPSLYLPSSVCLKVFKSAKENDVSYVVNIIKACRARLFLSHHLKQMPPVQRALLLSRFLQFYNNQIEKEKEADVSFCSPYGKHRNTDSITVHITREWDVWFHLAAFSLSYVSHLNIMNNFHICSVRSLAKKSTNKVIPQWQDGTVCPKWSGKECNHIHSKPF